MADLGPAVEEALAARSRGVPGPAFVECPVDLLYDEKLIRGWYADAAGKGTSIADRLPALVPEAPRRQDVRGQRRAVCAVAARAVPVPLARRGRRGARGRGAAPGRAAAAWCWAARRSSRPRTRRAVAEAVRAPGRAGLPVGDGARAAGPRRRRCRCGTRAARRCAKSDCVLLAGVPCDFRLDYGKHVRRSATLIAANRSRQDARLNRKPAIEAIGDAGRFIVALARARRRRAPGAPSGSRRSHARDAEREAEIDAQATGVRRAREPGRVLPRAGPRGGRQRDLRRRRRRLRRPPRPTSCARAGRSRGSIPARSARWAWAPASRSAPRS